MDKVVLIRFGELFLKGKNKGVFEKILLNNIKEKLQNVVCTVNHISGRYLVSNYNEIDEDKIVQELGEVFGIYSFSRAVCIETKDENIRDFVKNIKIEQKTFRMTIHNVDKTFPYNSQQYAVILGDIVLQNNEYLKVNLTKPDIEINVDIRESSRTFIYYDTVVGRKGLPVGSSSRGMLLLSGGIDSPVAGYLMARRGMPIVGLHFHSYPYTSEKAKEKVIKLSSIISKYTKNFDLLIINAKEIQEEIHKKCYAEFMITILRRFMMRIAEIMANKYNCKTILTGESLGQVASQTIESINTSNNVVDMPVLRPLIAFDKEEIVNIANDIATFETSILPYEDCCTVFLPKHPLIKPNLEKVLIEEKKLDMDKLIQNAINSLEIVKIRDYNN